VIFVDTSVWVEALRSGESETAKHLVTLLDSGEAALSAPVRIEILSGASNRDNAQLRRVLSALPLFFPTEETWKRIDGWLEQAREAGERFGFADMLIAAIAADQDAKVWSLDADFARMARIGLVEIHRAEASGAQERGASMSRGGADSAEPSPSEPSADKPDLQITHVDADRE